VTASKYPPALLELKQIFFLPASEPSAIFLHCNTMEQATAKLGAEVLDRILTAAMADPDTMCRVANDISPPTEPVQDYITDVDMRCALLDELRAFIGLGDEILLNATVFAAFMISPISDIRDFLQITRECRLPSVFVSGTLALAANAIRACRFLFPTQLSY